MKKSNIKNLSNILKIIHELDSFKLPVLLLGAFLNAAVPFAVALLSAEILNRLYKGQGGEELIRFALIAVLVICILSLLSSWVKKIDEVKKEQCIRLYNLRKSKKLMEMDFPEIENPSLGETLLHIRKEEDMGFSLMQVFSSMGHITKGIFTVTLTIIWLVPVIGGINNFGALWIALFALGVLILSALASYAFKKSNDKVFNMIRTFVSPEIDISEHMLYIGAYTYKDGKDTRIYGFQDALRNCVETAFQQMMAFTVPCCVKPAIAFGLSGISRALSMGLSYLFGALLVLNGSLELGTVVLFAALLFQCSDSLTDILVMGGFLIACAEGMQKMVKFTEIPESQYKGKIPVEKRVDNDFMIEFKNVSFKYPGGNDYALRDFSIKFKIGERLAIVGMNGSGKTTMIKLLCRLYDPTEGEILLNGIDVKKYDMKEYMSIFSVVFQDFKLFSLELGQVLAASVDYDGERAEKSLNRAGFGNRLSALSGGVKTMLYKDFDDGVEISGGEAQKIALARALYKNAPFIILDEPTAALDPVAEYEIYTRMNDIVGDKTAVFISHRLSSCRFCDDIAVFHEGRMIQRGNHDVLLADQSGKYHELWNAQAQHYKSQ